MSINQKTIDFLKELNATNPSTESIELYFMQISYLVPFLPLLSRFSNLKKLSLHGNRIKYLPVDMSQLLQLEYLDISNNMLNNCDMMIMSLKTLPRLRRLVCPFKKEDEDKIKKGLLQLEFLNNSKIVRYKLKPKEYPKKPNRHELKPEDIEQAAKLFDEVRYLYKSSYEQFDDEDMKRYFSDEVEQLVGDMRYSIGYENKTPEHLKSVIYLTTRYSMYKPSQAKIVGLLYDVDQKYGHIVDKLFQYESTVMKHLTEVAMYMTEKLAFLSMQQQHLPDTMKKYVKYEVTKDLSKFNKLEKEIKRLRKYRDYLQNDITALEAENKKYLDSLVRYSKGDKGILLNAGVPSRLEGSGSPKRPSTTNNFMAPSGANPKTRYFVAAPGGKSITLKQLRDTIEYIYESKVKFDQKTYESKLPRETMYQYLFTFLNQKYGLKNLTIEWASSIVSGIQNYSNEDNDVAVFGKILRNECDYYFRYVQAYVKSTILELLKMHLRTRHPLKTATEINDMIQERTNHYVSAYYCYDIVRYMYNKDDASDLIDKLRMVYALQPTRKEDQRKLLTREEQHSIHHDKEKKRLKYSAFVKCVLDYQMKSHEKYLKPLIQFFKGVDRDADGIVDEGQFGELISQMTEDADQMTEKMLNMVDPYSTNTITFSQVCKLLSQYPENYPLLTRYLKHNKD